MSEVITKSEKDAGSAWSPFGYSAFTVLWGATVASNIGTWMHDVASGWLMTSLAPSPMMVALVQTATTAPMFLFALSAGALADLVDRRRLLITVMTFLGLVACALAVLAFLELIDAWTLLLFTFMSGAGAAFVAPAWQAVVPQLVPRAHLQSAVALNSAGINISRAVGPALAGLIIAGFGIAWPYLFNAVSYLFVIGALIWWKAPASPRSDLPVERFGSAIRAGLRYVGASSTMRATLLRAAAFFLFASAYWALLPLIARQQLQGGPGLYGAMLGAVGVGAVSGALFLPRLKKLFSPDLVVAIGTAGTCLTLLVFALVDIPAAAVAVSFIAGASWIAVLSSLNVSAQLALPDWVRARGLSVFITVFFGCMTFGSMAWGQTASLLGIAPALVVAAVGAGLAAAASWPFKLGAGEGADLSPSMHWPAPIAAADLAYDRGPVMVTIEYRVAHVNIPDFVESMKELRAARRRSGAYAWGLFEDAADPGRFIEYFLEESWAAHLRQHERVAGADRKIQERVRALHVASEAPLVSHYLAPEPGGRKAPPLTKEGGLL